jgi:starch synthase
MRILFVTSEAFPLIKTGGLADVSHSLPLALEEAGHDVRIILPFYRSIKSKVISPECKFKGNIFGYSDTIAVYETLLSQQEAIVVWLVDAPSLFDREGGPYSDLNQQDWSDNGLRYASFARVVVELANNRLGQKWQPHIVHCNDWQTGLVVPLLQLEKKSPATVFTIHNIAYQGNFSRKVFESLQLPEDWWSINGIEFYGMCSFLKAGVLHADWVTTVSPSYAREIQEPEKGERFEGILRQRKDRLIGILNGIDSTKWNPETDPYITARYSKSELYLKAQNKKTLQHILNLSYGEGTPIFGMVCRLVYQKGIDLVLQILPELLRKNIQVVILGQGDRIYEQELLRLQELFPTHLSVTIGYDESFAHQIEAGSDFFVMPSRYEPCGLNQIYSLRYGTLPIVRRTGGLADTVVDATPQTIKDHTATGFIFDQATFDDLFIAINRALAVYQNGSLLLQMRVSAMCENFSWDISRQEYEKIYHRVLGERSLPGALVEP